MSEKRSVFGTAALSNIFVFTLFINVMMLIIPIYTLQVYDRVLTSASIETLGFISLMAVGALLLLSAMETLRSIYAGRIANRFDIQICQAAIEADMAGPRARIGDVQNLRDLETIRSFLSSRSLFTVFDLPYAPLFIALLWFVHPILFWITATGSVVLLILAGGNQALTVNGSRKSGEATIQAMSTAQSIVQNAELIRALGMVSNAIEAWAKHHGPALSAADAANKLSAVLVAISKFLRFGLQIAVLGAGALLVVEGEMTAGMIFAAVLIAGRALQPVDQLIGGWRQLIETRNAWRRLNVAVAHVPDAKSFTELPAPVGNLMVNRVVYLPPADMGQAEPILKQVSFQASPGRLLGVIGPSGSGKSTLARVLVGAVTPRSGEVRIDGADIRQWDPNLLGKHIGYLPQDVVLLPGTVAQNIARLSQHARDADIVWAAKAAQVHDLILSLPKGYDTVVGATGVALSGGQRQRIGLARAFFGRPRILVLDEPNANLDVEGEAALERAILEARGGGCTVVLIAQKTGIVGKADDLLVLRAGAVEHFGPYKEVAAKLALRHERQMVGAFDMRGKKIDPANVDTRKVG